MDTQAREEFQKKKEIAHPLPPEMFRKLCKFIDKYGEDYDVSFKWYFKKGRTIARESGSRNFFQLVFLMFAGHGKGSHKLLSRNCYSTAKTNRAPEKDTSTVGTLLEIQRTFAGVTVLGLDFYVIINVLKIMRNFIKIYSFLNASLILTVSQ